MGSQPIRIQLRKFLWENLAGKSCGKFLWEMFVGESCGKILQGKSCGTGRRGKSQFKKGSDWWKFSIWNRMMGSQPIRIQLGKILWEMFVGKSSRKLLLDIVARNSCAKILWEIVVGNSCQKFLQEIS